MAKNISKKGPPRGSDPVSELNQFLDAFIGLTSELSRGMTAQSTDADERAIISAYGKTLGEQASRLSEFIRINAQNIPAQTAVEIGYVLHLNAAAHLAESGKTISQNLSSTTAKIALGDIFNLLKKIIDVIVELLFGRDPLGSKR